ncbi:MAG: ATP-dependent helicase [Thermococcus sp.]|nr:ATP-dependent helicase [Thermococcus sp.]
MTVVRVFGPPGTGKTYTLNRIVYHLIGVENNTAFLQSYGLDLPHGAYTLPQIAYISFMNSAVDELLSRLGVKRNYRRGNWGTLHGLALHLLIKEKVIPKEMVSNTFRGKAGLYYWRKKFTYEAGLAYDPNEETKVLPGNQLFDGLSYAINVHYPRYNDLARVLDRLYDVYENPELVPYAEEWLKFKARNNIIDFDDILIYTYHARPPLDVPVLIVDEFQDFGPLQYEIFKAWAEDKDYVIVAGDDDQCITSEFAGANPRFLVELPGLGSDDDVVLRQSFRLPKVVHAVSVRFIETYVKYRHPKKFEPRNEIGLMLRLRVGWHQLPDLALKFASKGSSVLIMARTNALVRDIEKMLLERGIEHYRYKTRLTQVWRDFINRILDVVRAVRAGKKVSEADLRFFFRFTDVPEEQVRELAKVFSQGHVPLEAYKIFENPMAVIDGGRVAEYLGTQEKAELALKALRAVLEGKAIRPKGRITVETIHASKGREADVVFLVDHLTPRIYAGMSASQEAFEAEMRVWYVAMTRARHALIFVPVENPVVTGLLGRLGLNIPEA